MYELVKVKIRKMSSLAKVTIRFLIQDGLYQKIVSLPYKSSERNPRGFFHYGRVIVVKIRLKCIRTNWAFYCLSVLGLYDLSEVFFYFTSF